MNYVEGTVLGTIYRNEENGYSVIELSCEGNAVVCVGNLPLLQPGEYVRFYGAYSTHKNYGEQFKVASMETRLPEGRESIRLFLSGGLIKGVGEVLATRIVEAFGEETFEIIENEPMRLSTVKGVSAKLAESIHAQCGENAAARAAVMELQGLGLTLSQALKAFDRYGSAARELIERNPYRLIRDIHGVGFESADKIAAGLGLENFRELRTYNGIIYALERQSKNGHTCVPAELFKRHVGEILNADESEIEAAFMKLLLKGELVQNEYNGVAAVALERAYQAEDYGAYKLTLLSHATARAGVDINVARDYIRAAEVLSEEQERAILLAAERTVSVITGGPGTGKTTILNTLLAVFERCGLTVSLCAPTGRAAKRMEETTGHAAKTIHRLLEYGAAAAPDEDADCNFVRNEDYPLDLDALIVDESSMIDIYLLRSLLAAVQPGTRLVLVGDADQLPSVGPGNVLKDVIASGVVPVSTLTEVFRQSGNIALNAHRINKGQTPELFPTGDFVFMQTDGAEQTLELITKTYTELYNEGRQAQVICPMKKGAIGVYSINETIRERVNPMLAGKPELTRGQTIFREGDRVMQMVNNYSKEWFLRGSALTRGEGVFNGDTGVIDTVNQEGRSLRIAFDDGKIASYEASELEQLEHAYAITVHKSQGSEFDNVILPLFYGNSPFLTRNLLYTAITRAKKRVIIAGLKRTLEHMTKNDRQQGRYTCLDHELRRHEEFLNSLADGQPALF